MSKLTFASIDTSTKAMDKDAWSAMQQNFKGTLGWAHNAIEDGDRIYAAIIKLNRRSMVVIIEEADHEQNGTEITIPLKDWEAEQAHNMAGTLKKYRENYVVSVTADGRKSLSNGDELALLLEQLTGNQVARIAEIALGFEEGELVRKYEKLNNGQVRMNSGNRIRAAIKRGDITIDEVAAAKAA